MRHKQKDNKTLSIKLRFWTNDLELNNKKKPVMACWNGGAIILEANKSKKIKSSALIFNSFDDIIPSIKEIFRKNKIFVVSSNRIERM